MFQLESETPEKFSLPVYMWEEGVEWEKEGGPQSEWEHRKAYYIKSNEEIELELLSWKYVGHWYKWLKNLNQVNKSTIDTNDSLQEEHLMADQMGLNK